MSVIWTNLSFDDLIGDGVRGPKVDTTVRSLWSDSKASKPVSPLTETCDRKYCNGIKLSNSVIKSF